MIQAWMLLHQLIAIQKTFCVMVGPTRPLPLNPNLIVPETKLNSTNSTGELENKFSASPRKIVPLDFFFWLGRPWIGHRQTKKQFSGLRPEIFFSGKKIWLGRTACRRRCRGQAFEGPRMRKRYYIETNISSTRMNRNKFLGHCCRGSGLC